MRHVCRAIQRLESSTLAKVREEGREEIRKIIREAVVTLGEPGDDERREAYQYLLHLIGG